MSFLPLVLMFAVLYFIMIRPQMKRQKETKAMLEALAVGDEVLTVGGIMGKVTAMKDVVLTVEISPGTEVQIQKGAITAVLPKGTLKSA
jgi:preprotein translocase subunit YajC